MLVCGRRLRVLTRRKRRKKRGARGGKAEINAEKRKQEEEVYASAPWASPCLACAETGFTCPNGGDNFK